MSTKIEWTEDTWQPIEGFDKYLISTMGEVYSLRSEILLKPVLDKRYGHQYVFLYANGKSHKKFIHRLVLETYGGPCPPGMECRHLDGDPSNNKRSNLEWGTRQENTDDKKLHGTVPKGEVCKTAVLKADDVIAIREVYGTISSRKLAKKYGVSHTAIIRAAKGTKWAHIKS